MKGRRIVTVLLLCLVLASTTACNPFGGEREVTEELVEVVRGDLSVTVSGSGNIEVSNETKLTFGIGGRVDKIYVEKGDEVSEGEVLAKLETDTLELAVTQTQVAHNEAQVAVTQAEVAVGQAEVAVGQAEIAQQTAEYNLEIARDISIWSDIKAAQADVDEAEDYLEYCLEKLVKYVPPDEEGKYPNILEYVLSEAYPKLPGYGVWQERTVHAQVRLNAAEDRLDAMLYGWDTKEVAIKKLEVELAKQSLELTKQSLEQVKQSPRLAKESLELARQSLEQARKQLDKATITAPFDSVVASVAVDEKDTVTTVTTSVHLIDPSSMELEVQVDEIDVAEVKLGQRATIEVDALPALPLESKVKSISLLPTEEAGVIVYDVRIEFHVAEGTGLRAGMSATADIVIAERSNVLLVPDRAIKQDSQGNPIVGVVVDEQVEERAVVIGISDGFQTAILDGLEEGEVVERRAKSK